jgi:hypothetical protein
VKNCDSVMVDCFNHQYFLIGVYIHIKKEVSLPHPVVVHLIEMCYKVTFLIWIWKLVQVGRSRHLGMLQFESYKLWCRHLNIECSNGRNAVACY